MAATYPGGIVAFPTRSDGQVIAAAHMNGVQDEIMAIESALLNGFAHEVKFAQALSLISGGVVSPPQITADQNDYNPTGLGTASMLRLTSDASRNITGVAAQSAGRVLRIMNVGAQPLVLKNGSASSAAANRIIGAGGVDQTLLAGDACTLFYDTVSSMWRMHDVSRGHQTNAWTPTLIGSTSGSATVTSAVGLYTRSGHIVHIDALVTISGVGTLVGNVLMGGLPFTSNGTLRATMMADFSGLAAAVAGVFGSLPTSSTTINLMKIAAAGGTASANMVAADLTGTTVLRVSGRYFAP